MVATGEAVSMFRENTLLASSHCVLALYFCFQQMLDPSKFWLAAIFGWEPRKAGGHFWLESIFGLQPL